MREGAEFPPLVVFDDGEKLRLVYGFLRDAASERAGLEVVPCDVRRGTHHDAQLYAIQANGRHGKTLTRADRQLAVERLLDDPEWSRWSNRVIGKLAGVSHSVVNKMRRRRAEKGQPRVVIRSGQVYEWTRPKEPRPPNYYSDYLYYLVRLSPQQYIRLKEIVNFRADRKVIAQAIETVVAVTSQPAAAPNNSTNWQLYLPTMTPQQLVRWRDIIKSRIDLAVLAEAVDIVMREAAAQAGQQPSGHVAG